MIWDDRVITPALAVKYYESEALHWKAGHTYNSTEGKVVLGEDRNYTLNGEAKRAGQ